jgi:lipid-binding SYLF domain-containing protein
MEEVRKMKRTERYALLLVGIFLFFFVAFLSSAQAATAGSIIDDSVSVLKEMMKQDDADSMADVIREAYAIAFVPSMVKAGLIVGGEYGEGLILLRKGKTWYGPSFYNLGGGSLGLQIGAQKISLVLVVANEAGVNAFLKSKTKLGADVAVAAGPLGRQGQAATDGQLKASIYNYSMTKGLFAGVSLDGSVLSISVKRNQEYWKKEMSAEQALKTRATDRRILPLIQAIDGISKKAK